MWNKTVLIFFHEFPFEEDCIGKDPVPSGSDSSSEIVNMLKFLVPVIENSASPSLFKNVRESSEEADDVLPATSVAVAVIEYTPSKRDDKNPPSLSGDTVSMSEEPL